MNIQGPKAKMELLESVLTAYKNQLTVEVL